MAFAAALLMGVVAGLLALMSATEMAPGYTAVALLVGSAGLLILAARRTESPRGPRLFGILLLLNAASLAVSTALSTNRALSLYGGTGRCFGALMQCVTMLFAWLVAWQSAGLPELARVVMRGVSIAGFIVAAYGAVRPPGTLGDASHLVTWLLMSAFLSIALSRMETHFGWRGLARSLAALTLAGLIVIGARSAPRAGTNQRSDSHQGSDSHRLLWRDSLSMAARRSVVGYGPEVFLAEFPRFESKALAEANPDAIYESPRNALLDALVSQGAPGVLLLGALCIASFTAAWKRRDVWLAAALAVGVVGLQFNSFNVPMAVLFLTTIALTTALAEQPAAPRPSPIFSAVAPVLVVALLYFALRLTIAGHALATTRRLLAGRDLQAATGEYDAYEFWRLPGASADLWYSRSWLEVARTATDSSVRSQAVAIAEQAAQRAVANSEEPFLAWYNSAQISAFQDHFEDAERSLRWAISTHPNWYLPHWMLAQQLLRESRLDESQKEAALAAELDAGHHPEIAPMFVIR